VEQALLQERSAPCSSFLRGAAALRGVEAARRRGGGGPAAGRWCFFFLKYTGELRIFVLRREEIVYTTRAKLV